MEISEQELLVPLEDYLRAGVHIGTSSGMASMSDYIYRVRNDGLFVLDVRKTDERIRVAAKFLARHDPPSVVACSVRTYGIYPTERFCQFTGATPVTGRFIPGQFTNPSLKGRYQFLEPEIVVLVDSNVDRQALKEAGEMGIPVVALCDTDNSNSNIELVIPANNKGRNSLGIVFYLLTRQILQERDEWSPEDDEKLNVEMFRAPRGRRTYAEERSELP